MEQNNPKSDKTSDLRVIESFKLESFNIPGFVHSQHINLLLYGSVRKDKKLFLERLFHIEIDDTTKCIFQKGVNGKWKHFNQLNLAELLTEPCHEEIHATSYKQLASESYNWVHIFDCSSGIQITEISRKLNKGRTLAICFEEFRDGPDAAIKSYIHSIISLSETKALEERHSHPSIAFVNIAGNEVQMWDTILYELYQFRKYFIFSHPFVLPFNPDVGDEILTNLLEPLLKDSALLKYTEHIFDVAVQIMSLIKKEGLLAIETCLKIGEQLGMNEDEVISYFINHSKFHYFPAVLPNVVFVQTHYLIGLLSNLSKPHASLEEQCHQSGVINEFALNSLFFSPLFTHDNFISLLKYLLLITSIEVLDSSTLNNETPIMTKQLFMPSLLPSTASLEEDEDYFKDIDYQIYLYFDDHVLPQGLFLATVVALLNRKDEPTFILGSSHTNSCYQMRNCVELFSIDLLGTVILVNDFNHITVHFTGDEENAYDHLRDILEKTVISCAEPLALDQSLHFLNVSTSPPENKRGIPSVKLYSSIEDIQLSEDRTTIRARSSGFSMNIIIIAMLCLPIVLLWAIGIFVARSTRSIVKSIMRCCRRYEHNEVEPANNAHNESITAPTGQHILEENNQFFTNETPTQRDVFKQLIIIYHLWYNIGIALKVSHANLSSQLQSVHSDQLKLQRVLGFWIKKQCTDDISWTTIIIAVESNIVRQKNLGKKLREQFKESPSYSLLETEKNLLLQDHFTDMDKVMMDTPSKRALCEILAPVCYKWEDIGIALGVENGVLKCEEQSNRSDFIKLAIVIQDWLDNCCETTWYIVESAVKGDIVEQQDLALEIQEFLQTN